MEHSDAGQPLRVTPDRRLADDWALALASAGIDTRLDWSTQGYVLTVRDTDRQRADAVLDAFDDENRHQDSAGSDRFEIGTSSAAVVIAALLCAFFVVTGPRDAGGEWFQRGGAIASRIRAGELWRTVTALTLHADFPHVLSNALTLLIFGGALCGLVGVGIGVWLMLVSGATGNWITALVRGPPYNAVGASTAVFGAVGALAAIQLVRRRRGASVPAWRVWAPIAAGLALLGFLGTAPESDVLAHLFGFAVGALLGLGAARAEGLRDRRGLQLTLALGGLLVVVACWLLALV